MPALVHRLAATVVTAIAGFASLGAAAPLVEAVAEPVAESAAGRPIPLASCVSWDIKALCCPGYCAAKAGTNWSSADKMFDACIVALGCKSGSTNGFLSCDCPKK